MRWTEQQAADHMARMKRNTAGAVDTHTPDPGPEKTLASKIRRWAQDKCHVALVVPEDPAIRKILPAGWPDVVLFLPERVVCVELKAAKGRIRQEQAQVCNMLRYHGHEYHVCKSWRHFMEIVDGSGRTTD